jgi:hypothetical protein
MRAVLAATLAAAACGPREPPAEPGATPTCDDAPGWRYEKIDLPPPFAPRLPEGVEILYFAPGMFEPSAPDYWSYVFSIRTERPVATDATSLQVMLQQYYAGLIGAVARSRKLDLPKPPASVLVEPPGDRSHVARVNTYDAFTGGQPLAVNLDVRLAGDGRCMNVAASAAGLGAPVWSQLEQARRCVPCP